MTERVYTSNEKQERSIPLLFVSAQISWRSCYTVRQTRKSSVTGATPGPLWWIVSWLNNTPSICKYSYHEVPRDRTRTRSPTSRKQRHQDKQYNQVPKTFAVGNSSFFFSHPQPPTVIGPTRAQICWLWHLRWGQPIRSIATKKRFWMQVVESVCTGKWFEGRITKADVGKKKKGIRPSYVF